MSVRSRAVVAIVVGAACVAPLACNGILGNRAGHPYDDAGADGETNDGAIAMCDGGCPPIALATTRDCPVDLAVTNGRVYWVDQGSVQNSAQDGVVASVPVGGCTDGSSACIVVHASNERSPSALAVNKDAIWWASLGVPSTNSAIRTLAFGDTTPTIFASSQRFPRSLALDATSVFWINGGDAPPTANGEVRRQFFDSPGSVAIVFTLEAPVAITVRGSTIFWTNDGDSDTTGYVMTSDITGSPSTQVARNQSHPRGIAAGGTYVYWANTGDGTIMRARPDGTGVLRVLADRATPSDVAVDDLAIYWVETGTPPDYADGKVMAARLDGSDVRTIASSQKNARRIALDATNVYWVARGTPGCAMHDGRIMQAGKVF